MVGHGVGMISGSQVGVWYRHGLDTKGGDNRHIEPRLEAQLFRSATRLVKPAGLFNICGSIPLGTEELEIKVRSSEIMR